MTHAFSLLPQPLGRNHPPQGLLLFEPTTGRSCSRFQRLCCVPAAQARDPTHRFCSTDKSSCKGLKSVLPPSHPGEQLHLRISPTARRKKKLKIKSSLPSVPRLMLSRNRRKAPAHMEQPCKGQKDNGSTYKTTTQKAKKQQRGLCPFRITSC